MTRQTSSHHVVHRFLMDTLERRQLLAAGALDPSFSGDGRGTVDFGAGITVSATGAAVQSNGKTVVVGTASYGFAAPRDFALARFNFDGSVDATFGANR